MKINWRGAFFQQTTSTVAYTALARDKLNRLQPRGLVVCMGKPES